MRRATADRERGRINSNLEEEEDKACSADAALGLWADLDGSRAALVGAPEQAPLARLHDELPKLQLLDGRSCLICLHSWHLKKKKRNLTSFGQPTSCIMLWSSVSIDSFQK